MRDSEGRRVSPKLRREIREVLQASGFDDLAVVATAAPFDEMEARVLAARKAAQASIGESQAARARLEALRLWHLDNLLTEGSVITRSLGDAVIRGRGLTMKGAAHEIDKILHHADARLQTLYDTAVSIYSRQVEGELAGDDPMTPFFYAHPVDFKTRPFCLQYAGKVLIRQEIDALDNGQLSNVFLTGGGFNCRGHWLQISSFSELTALIGTDERAPEVSEEMAELFGETRER